jgi:uncharacterized protein (DUF2141 family)
MKISGQTVAGTGESEQNSLLENLYPNPASDEIAVTVKSKGLIKFQIIDASGKTVLVKQESISIPGEIILISIKELVPGIYILIIQDEKGNASKRRFIIL